VTRGKFGAAAAASLPSLATVLNLPAAIGGVSTAELLWVLEQGYRDLPQIIEMLRNAPVSAAELTAEDALELASLVGVPGSALAATLAPYLFDFLNAEISSGGVVTVQSFVNTLDIANSNLGTIIVDIANHDFLDAGDLELMDAISVVAVVFPGPASTIAQIIVKAAFALAKAKGDPLGFALIFEAVGHMTADIGEIVNELEGKPVLSADGRFEYSPVWGWVPYIPVAHTALRYDGRKKTPQPPKETT
jgi:hypothetical protein